MTVKIVFFTANCATRLLTIVRDKVLINCFALFPAEGNSTFEDDDAENSHKKIKNTQVGRRIAEEFQDRNENTSDSKVPQHRRKK
jgi:hypothetical protein